MSDESPIRIKDAQTELRNEIVSAIEKYEERTGLRIFNEIDYIKVTSPLGHVQIYFKQKRLII